MPASPDLLIQRVQDSLKQAQAYTTRHRKLHTTLTIMGIITSALTTLVAGGTATQGMLSPTRLDWPVAACSLAALLSLVAAITGGLNQQWNLAERLMQGQNCVGRLRAIDVAFATGSRSPEELARDYEDIVRTFTVVLEPV
jgi:hypothetical protein